MKRRLLLVLICAISALVQARAQAQAQAQARPIISDPRLQTIVYDANQVVRLRIAAGFQLTVLFNPEERVENVAVGDSEAWQVTLNGRGDALFIKPLAARGPTNMTVITDARIYSFELSPAYGPSADTPFTVRFQYLAIGKETPVATEIVREDRRYRLSGSRSVRPATVTDDSVRTYIAWRPGQPLPAVFAIDEQGQEILLDGYVRDGRYVIDSLHRALVFRLDRQTARASRLGSRSER